MAALETIKKLRESITREKTGGQTIDFTYYDPKAKKVCLAGKFNGWNPKSLPMKKNKDGMWKLAIKLPPGRHEYKFFVDGAWSQQLPCSNTAFNPFGTYNCVIGVE